MHGILIKTGYLSIIISFSVFVFSTNATSPDNANILASVQQQGYLVADFWVNKSFKSVTSTYYADACSFYGACLFGTANNDSSYTKFILDKYIDNLPNSIPTGDVDKNSVAILPLHLFQMKNDSALLRLGKAAADASLKSAGYKRYAIDDTYMTGSLMIQAYRVTGDTKYLDFCADYIIEYMGKLQQPNGLYWHRVGSKVFWGRGNGWGAASTTELLLSLPLDHPKRAAVLEGFKKHMTGLLAVQKNNGMWMQVLTSTNSKNYEETSGTGMFLFAMFTGLKNGWLDKSSFLDPATKGWNALSGYVGNDGKLKNICVGFWGDGTENSYLNAATEAGNAHGTCAFLWTATAILNLFQQTPVKRQVSPMPLIVPSGKSTSIMVDLTGRIVRIGTTSIRKDRIQSPGFYIYRYNNTTTNRLSF